MPARCGDSASTNCKAEQEPDQPPSFLPKRVEEGCALRKRILVCDDDPLLLDIVKFRLSARDFDVEVAADGAEALSKIGASLPDAIVLDAMMPVMDGQQVLRRLKSDPQTASVPVIMLSARKQETDVLGALEDGANEYMVKPFSPDELIIRLSRLLERKS